MKKHALIYICLGLVLAYHAANLLMNSHYGPKHAILHEKIMVVIGKTRLKIKSWYFRPQTKDENFDVVSAEIKWAGYKNRYWMGDLPPFIWKGNSDEAPFLFHREEIPLQYLSQLPKIENQLYAPVKTVLTTLVNAGISIHALPVPTKLAFERNQTDKLPSPLLGWVTDPNEKENPHAVYNALVEQAPHNIINLQSAYEREKVGLFVPIATHWSSKGIALAAKTTLDHLRKQGFRVPEVELAETKEVLNTSKGDLLETLQMREGEISWPEKIYTLRGKPPQQPAVKGRVFLAGTCYALRFSGKPYALEAYLSKYVGRPVQQLSLPAQGAEGGLERLKDLKINKDDLIIWEFPVRQMFKAS